MKVEFQGKTKLADHIWTFSFKPEQNVRFIAGQFIELYLPNSNKDSGGDRRWFTISSAPSDPFIQITTKLADEIGSPFKHALSALRKGQTVSMAWPMGDFVLPKDTSIPLVFVAGGIGCTPFHSIIRELQLTGEKRDVTLLYAANHIDDIAFKETFNKLGPKFKIILQEPGKNWKGETGRLDANKIKDLAHVTDRHYIYVSGPEPMTESLYNGLRTSGINKRHILTDYFPNYTDI